MSVTTIVSTAMLESRTPWHICPHACAAREAVYKWWRTDNMPATLEGPRLMGKPSVRFRKVVNTTTDDGQMVAVTAQQYCVLVMDVPDLEAAAMKQLEREQKAASHVGWWKKWTRQTATHTDDANTPSDQSAKDDVEGGKIGTVIHPIMSRHVTLFLGWSAGRRPESQQQKQTTLMQALFM